MITRIDLTHLLENGPTKASAPCRIDMGGTLDISTFNYPLRHDFPCTFNMALDLRTRVVLSAHEEGMVKISSKGFESAEFPAQCAPYDHPLGLMFAVADYFGARGVHIRIESASPPRSALGGSSVAAVALIAAFLKTKGHVTFNGGEKKDIAMLAHAIEQSVAGVPCGIQDQLSAAFGGTNLWMWGAGPSTGTYKSHSLLDTLSPEKIHDRILVGYCGIPHVSKDVNSTWVKRFLEGHDRDKWQKIIRLTRSFFEAFQRQDMTAAADHMNNETWIRKKMTPHVLDKTGDMLFQAAVGENCGARFTGAGGGGCLWAVGEADHIKTLRKKWATILSSVKDAAILKFNIDADGVL